MNMEDNIRNALNTSLHFAAANDDSEFAKILLARGAEVNAKSKIGLTPLHEAVRNDSLKAVEVLLSAGANIARSSILLHEAIGNDSLKMVEVLLSAGANIARSSILLRKAVRNDSLKMVEVLLSAGANIDAGDRSLPVLHEAAGEAGPKVIKALLDAGADIHAQATLGSTRISTGFTALHIAAWRAGPKVIEVLLDAGADIHARDKWGMTPLLRAGLNPNPKVIEVLLDAGADIHARDQDGLTSLHFATKIEMRLDRGDHVLAVCSYFIGLAITNTKDRPEVVEVLLSAGANIDARTEAGWTPLHFAAYYGATKVVEVLLSAGADIGAITEVGEDPFHVASDDPELLAVLSKLRRTHYLAKPITELYLSVRVSNLLETANIKTIRELVRKEERQLLEYKNFGPISLNEIKYQLANIGLTLGMNPEDEEDKVD